MSKYHFSPSRGHLNFCCILSLSLILSIAYIQSTTGKEKESGHLGHSLDIVDGMAPVIRHRKIYMTPAKQRTDPPKTIPVKVTIHVEPPETNKFVIPPPKPIYRLHKYTKLNTTTETHMVPIKTTVIKPAGLSDDQIVKDE